MSKSEDKSGVIQLFFAMIIMGTVGLFVIESGQSAYNVVFYRCLLGAFFLVVYCLYSGKFKGLELSAKSVLIIVLSGIFLVFNWVMLFESFKTASISTSTVIYHAQPFFFMLIWAALYRERVSANKIGWMVISFVGVAFVANIDTNEFSLSSSYIIGVILALSAAVFWAISAVIVKSLKGVSPYIITLVQLCIGIVVLYPLSDLSGFSSITVKEWGCLFILGAVHSCLTYILMYSSYQKLSAPIIAVMTFIYPAVAIVVDYYFYNVALSAIQLIGVFMIMFSSYAVNQNFSIFSRKKVKA
ncbi:DMT family transporter [Serratia sp. NPDC078593]|uniref:DMT family transporter n=1 Tax=unclassified Serratia (in: enterobacteria) TaxID=2647522 RepID=UPI0037D12F03